MPSTLLLTLIQKPGGVKNDCLDCHHYPRQRTIHDAACPATTTPGKDSRLRAMLARGR